VPTEGGTVGEGAWLMLLDLYRLGGHRQRFEARVLAACRTTPCKMPHRPRILRA